MRLLDPNFAIAHSLPSPYRRFLQVFVFYILNSSPAPTFSFPLCLLLPLETDAQIAYADLEREKGGKYRTGAVTVVPLSLMQWLDRKFEAGAGVHDTAQMSGGT